MILKFDPKSRQSSRRKDDQTRARDREYKKRIAIEARTLRLSVKAFVADEGVYYHFDDICAIEAGYKEGHAAGREAVIAVIRQHRSDDYNSGVRDERGMLDHIFRDALAGTALKLGMP